MVKAVIANRDDLVKFTKSWAQKDLDSILALYADAVKTKPDFMKFFDILKWVQAPLPNYRNTIDHPHQRKYAVRRSREPATRVGLRGANRLCLVFDQGHMRQVSLLPLLSLSITDSWLHLDREGMTMPWVLARPQDIKIMANGDVVQYEEM